MIDLCRSLALLAALLGSASAVPTQLTKDEGQCSDPATCPSLGGNAGNDNDAYNNDGYSYPTHAGEQLRRAIEHRLDSRHDGLLHRHLERSHIRRTFPDALSNSQRWAGNYTDGTKAGSSQWLGDVGAQPSSWRARKVAARGKGEAMSWGTPTAAEVEAGHTYASFGSVLDLSSGPDARWSTMAWMASLLRRKELVADTDRSDGHDPKPCRLDLLDDYDANDDVCWLPATMDDYVAVRRSEWEAGEDAEAAAYFGIRDKGEFVVHPGDWTKLPEGFVDGKKFDTIIADATLATRHDDDDDSDGDGVAMEDADLVMKNLAGLLNPGGAIYFVGNEPPRNRGNKKDKKEFPARLYDDAANVLDAVKSLSGVYPKKDLSARWVHRTAAGLGLNVFDSTVFNAHLDVDGMYSILEEAKAWADDLAADPANEGMMHSVYEELLSVSDGIEHAEQVGAGEIPAGYDYVVAAELPSPEKEARAGPAKPKMKARKGHYDDDTACAIEELDLKPLKRGEFQEYRWKNGDDYDGLAGRVGVPPHLASTIRDYVKKLGIWDVMIDTILHDPMGLNTTRFYTVETPFGDRKRNFTWSAKRPDNFYGSDSDMHWFDIADEAAHEDSLRALAAGGFDEVLHAIGTHLGLNHLVTFSIGLLAVTKADKGYVHVDFTQSEGRAFNFLINLDTPGGAGPELSVVEEDDLGNRRRGQVKYDNTFGVLNGDDAMHATNECNHRASNGVRLTASIFIAELEEESLFQVANHDKYYFPFGNMDWIWAQRGRHWNREGTVSLVDDKGREPFEAEDAMDNCEERVGDKGERCTMHGPERMLCYKTCGTFMEDDDFRPGAPRGEIFGW